MLFKHESLPPKAAKIGTLCITPGFQAHLRRWGHWYTAIGHQQPGGRRYDHQHCSEVSDGGRLPRDDRHHPGGNAQAPRRTVHVKHAPIVSPATYRSAGLRGRTWSTVNNMSGSWRLIPLSAKRGCARSAGRSPIRNFVKAASRASISV